MLALWKKAMTKLYSILKSKDFTLPTKAHLVKVMVFPVVIYGYEIWTIQTLVGKVMSLLFNTLSRFVTAFLT